jgi:acylphosphatase
VKLVRVRAVVRGRVQGVGFRAFTREQAEALGLVGQVCNLSDGSVEVVAEGEREAAERLLEILKGAFWAARVDGLSADFGEPSGEFSGFSIGF